MPTLLGCLFRLAVVVLVDRAMEMDRAVGFLCAAVVCSSLYRIGFLYTRTVGRRGK